MRWLITLLAAILLPMPCFAATLIAVANNNFTTSATWATVDTTSLLDSQTATAPTSTLYSGERSQVFATGIITVDGIALKVQTRSASPTGTFSVELYNSTLAAAVAGTEVTVNVTDFTLDANVTNSSTLPSGLGWYFFKFASPVTLLAATNYAVEAKSSTSSQVTLWRSGVAGNISRMLRTTTTAAPAAADNWYICKEWTAAATGTARTVTMDSTATTAYGTVATLSAGICAGGTMTYGTTASTNYVLRQRGYMVIWPGGTLNIGTTGTPEPITSTAKLQFDCTADGDTGLECLGGTINIQGVARTSAKNITWTKLNTDEAANSTSLGVADDTGWLDNDEITAVSTTQTYSQGEQGTMNGAAGASTLTVDGFAGTGGGFLNAHSGTSPTQGEIGNRTRNVIVEGVSSSLPGYFYCDWIHSVDIDWAEFRNLGESAATRQRGVSINAVSGSSFVMSYSSVHDTEDYGLYLVGPSSGSYTVKVEYTVCDNLSTASANEGVSLLSTAGTPSGTGFVFDHNLVCRTSPNNGNNGMFIRTMGNGSITNNSFASLRGSNVGITGAVYIQPPTVIPTAFTFSNNIIHSNAGGGFTFGQSGASTLALGANSTLSGNSIWRNANTGVALQSLVDSVTFTSFTIFGNATDNITGTATSSGATYIFDGCIIAGDSTFATTNGFRNSGATTYSGTTIFYNCTFGSASGIYVAHTNDINVLASDLPTIVRLNKCKLDSATEITGLTNFNEQSYISSDMHDQTAGSYYRWMRYGIQQRDTGLDHGTDGASERLTPNSNTSTSVSTYAQLTSGPQTARVASGATKTFHVYVQKSASYNGGQPTLYLRRNDAIGITADTLLDTMTVGTGSWEELTGTTPTTTGKGVFTIEVRCNGTAGYINVDDWSVT